MMFMPGTSILGLEYFTGEGTNHVLATTDESQTQINFDQPNFNSVEIDAGYASVSVRRGSFSGGEPGRSCFFCWKRCWLWLFFCSRSCITMEQPRPFSEDFMRIPLRFAAGCGLFWYFLPSKSFTFQKR